MMTLTILGSGSASPTISAFQSSQVLELAGETFLIDCGEGCQMRLVQYGFDLNQIDGIFISHAHLDHYIGLPGLFHRSWLQDRRRPLDLFAPRAVFDKLAPIFEDIYPGFKLMMKEIEPNKPYILKRSDTNSDITVSTIPLRHDGETSGFLFEENGVKRYAYCSDTAYDETILPQIEGVEALYHEATYTERIGQYAATNGHSTARQAATIAKLANAGQLVIGHYSIRNQDYKAFEKEARQIFEKTVAGYDGLQVKIN
ncbi:MAG: ribonuclease Z [Tannerellaceae bacterium]|jgi:ribonuclease Z|nr:ribonuclease Z [Tannerellaceae bacterium]